MLDNIALEACLFSAFIFMTMATLVGMDNTNRQATASKQVEIFFKLFIVLSIFSGSFTFFFDVFFWTFYTV